MMNDKNSFVKPLAKEMIPEAIKTININQSATGMPRNSGGLQSGTGGSGGGSSSGGGGAGGGGY